MLLSKVQLRSSTTQLSPNSPREYGKISTSQFQPKLMLNKACIISTLLYCSESWSTYSTQEWKLQVFHLRCLCRILGITWQDKVSNNDILSRDNIPSMFTLLHQGHLCWLGHLHRMKDGHIPKDLLYGKLTSWARHRGHPQLCFKDICKHDMKVCNIDTESWEASADSRTL